MKISFGIKTNLRNEIKTLITVLSIRAQGIPLTDYEIMITGRTDFKYLGGLAQENLRLFPDPASADSGKLGLMMNTLAANARFDTVCLMDDDFILLDGWYDALLTWLHEVTAFDVLSFPIKNTDGSRSFDHCYCRNWPGTGPRLLRKNVSSPHVFIAGGFTLFKKTIWDRVQWDNQKGFYQAEDFDWSIRVKAAGFAITHCPIAYVVHNDWRYCQNGFKLVKLNTPRERLALVRNRFLQLDNSLATIKELIGYIAGRLFRLRKSLVADIRWNLRKHTLE
jgi:GT2 family glycosyltransferase